MAAKARKIKLKERGSQNMAQHIKVNLLWRQNESAQRRSSGGLALKLELLFEASQLQHHGQHPSPVLCADDAPPSQTPGA